MLEINDSTKIILDSLAEGINIIDKDDRILFVNKSYREFIGFDDEDIVGKKLRDLRPSAQLPDVIRYKTNLMHVLRNEDGDSYFVNMYPITSKKGEVLGGISIVTFIDSALEFKKEIERLELHTKKLLNRLNKVNSTKYTFDSITGTSESILASKKTALEIARTDINVLLESETGTGKELFAHAIHNASDRKDEVFIAINCANFRGEILDSELFGYVEGAFTGAKKGGKMGLFEAANKGTLFLDEVSEIDISLQAKLLRALQEKRIRPVGAVEDLPVDVRIICATNTNLLDYIKEGKFRADLYYRLSGFPINIPPLRERKADIPLITAEKLEEISKKLKRIISISDEAMDLLIDYDWPGNIRELISVLEFSAFKAENSVITKDSLPDSLSSVEVQASDRTLIERVKDFEKREIQRELSLYGDSTLSKKKVAAKLGISLASLYNKINK